MWLEIENWYKNCIKGFLHIRHSLEQGTLGPMSCAMYSGLMLMHLTCKSRRVYLFEWALSSQPRELFTHEKAWSIYLYIDEIWLYLFMGHQPRYILDKAHEWYFKYIEVCKWIRVYDSLHRETIHIVNRQHDLHCISTQLNTLSLICTKK